MPTKLPINPIENGTISLAQDGPFRALIRTYGAVNRVMEPYFARFGLGASQWSVLRALHRAEESGATSLRLTDLSDRLLVRPPSITEVVNRLLRDALVEREDDQTDQRSKHVKLTRAGRKIVQRILQGHAGQINLLLDGLDRTERTELARLLDKLRAHVEGMIAPNAAKQRRGKRTAV